MLSMTYYVIVRYPSHPDISGVENRQKSLHMFVSVDLSPLKPICDFQINIIVCSFLLCLCYAPGMRGKRNLHFTATRTSGVPLSRVKHFLLNHVLTVSTDKAVVTYLQSTSAVVSTYI